MASTYTFTSTNGDTTTSTEYTGSKKAFQYTVIGDDLKTHFDFLTETGSIAAKLDEMLSYLKSAADINDGFYLDSVSDLNHVYTEIEADVNNLKNTLSTLHSALITDIDNVNAELEVNFGHWVGYKVDKGKTTTTTRKSNP